MSFLSAAKANLTLGLAMLVAASSFSCATLAQSIPPYVASGQLLPLILQMPANSWLLVNNNIFSDVWTPPSLEPLNRGAPSPPSKIIQPWSSFAWDSNRGDLIIYGGGHAFASSIATSARTTAKPHSRDVDSVCAPSHRQ